MKGGATVARVHEMIKQRRGELGMTLLQLAESVGVKEATAQRWESGAIKTIPYDRLIQIAEVLRCSPVYLMGWEEEKPTTPEGDGLNEEQRALMDLYDSLGPADRAALVASAKALAEARKSQGEP